MKPSHGCSRKNTDCLLYQERPKTISILSCFASWTHWEACTSPRHEASKWYVIVVRWYWAGNFHRIQILAIKPAFKGSQFNVYRWAILKASHTVIHTFESWLWGGLLLCKWSSKRSSSPLPRGSSWQQLGFQETSCHELYFIFQLSFLNLRRRAVLQGVDFDLWSGARKFW